MHYSVIMVCAHCGATEACAEGVDVLVCTLTLMPWRCPSCGRTRALVTKPDTDPDGN